MVLPNFEQLDLLRAKGWRPQVVGCFVCNKKILFLYKQKHDLWQLPQGGIDNNEDLPMALSREMTEELGDNFKNSYFELITTAKVEFPAKTQGSRQLKTDNGKTVFMKGKYYHFCLLKIDINQLDIAKTEFNDYVFAGYDQARKLIDKIKQKGKQRITKKIIEELKKSGHL